MYRTIIVFILIFFNFNLFGQKLFSVYDFPEKIPSSYIINPLEDYDKIMEKIRYSSDLSVGDASILAEAIAYQKEKMFISGEIYIGWSELEEYLNNILQKVTPENYKKEVYIYAIRDSEYNAYASFDGTLYFNIGLLADLPNEASLALIIAHELVHYIKEDALNRYVMKVGKRDKKGLSEEDLEISNASFSQWREKVADSLGFIYANDAGYDISNGIVSFLMLIEQEEKYKSSDDYVSVGSTFSKVYKNEEDAVEQSAIEKLLLSHPETADRIEYLKEIMEGLDHLGAHDYLVSESTFNKLQSAARIEVLDFNLRNFNYKECVEKAFYYHLFEPENEIYIYYLLEGLRRWVYLNPDLIREGFITDNYSAYFEYGQGILHDLLFIVRDSLLYNQINATELVDSSVIEFETYGEAFDYFSIIAEKHEFTEAYLTIALYSNKNEEIRNQYLEKYLAAEDIFYREYAESLKNNALNDFLNDRGLKSYVIFSEIDFIVARGNKIKYSYNINSEKTKNYYSAIEKFYDDYFDNRKVSYIYDLASNNLGQYVSIKEAFISSILTDISNRESIEETREEEEGSTRGETYYFDDEDDVAAEHDKDEKKKRKKTKSNANIEEEQITDMNDLFLLNPYYWNVFTENSLKGIELIKLVDYRQKSVWQHMAKYNPLKILLLPYGFLYTDNLLFGSDFYEFQILYYSYQKDNNKAFYYLENVPYKMSKMNMLNSIYYATKYSEQ